MLNDDIFRHFFHFAKKTLILWTVRGVNGQKETQNEK